MVVISLQEYAYEWGEDVYLIQSLPNPHNQSNVNQVAFITVYYTETTIRPA